MAQKAVNIRGEQRNEGYEAFIRLGSRWHLDVYSVWQSLYRDRKILFVPPTPQGVNDEE